MNTIFNKNLLAIAVIIAILFPSISFANSPTYIRNEKNKKVIYAPHVFEFSSENKDKYGWCGHAALKSAMSAFGVNKSLTEIHETLQKIDPDGKKYGYTKYNAECGIRDGKGFCAEISLLRDGAQKFGLNVTRSNAYNQNQLFQGVKQAIILEK